MSISRSAKVTRPAFGQRSTYQAEAIDTGQSPGYFFQRAKPIGSVYTDSVRGIYCSVSTHGPSLDANHKYLVDSLYENNEQTSIIVKNQIASPYSDVKIYGFWWNTDRKYEWFIKPRMRIDTTVSNHMADTNTVVTIEIYAFNGSLIKQVPIRVSNFHHIDSIYKGNYIENYFFANGSGLNLNVTGEQLSHGADSAGYYTQTNNSKVDYRVRWNGQVDVWLDYVRVDDEWSHYLFTDDYAHEMANADNRWKFHHKLDSEITQIGDVNGFGHFYFDEFYLNNIECMAKVNEIIKSINPNLGMVVMAFPWSGGTLYKRYPLADSVYALLKRKGLMSEGVMVDLYPINMTQPYPSNLNLASSSTYPAVDNYVKATNGNNYNDKLNETLDKDAYYDGMKLVSKTVKSFTNNEFVVCSIQAHTVESNLPCAGTNSLEGRREPTNEEIRMLAYLALAHGAKQIQYFQQNSWTSYPETCPSTHHYDWGLSALPPDDSIHGRTSNYYFQNKFDSIAAYNVKILKTGKLMYDSLNLKFEDERAFLKDGVTGTDIQDLKTYTNATLDAISPVDRRYWNFGFFNKDNTVEPYSYAKYFIAVNRSCMPDTAGQGDIKELRIQFRAANLPDFNNWNLIDPVNNNQVLGTFDKNAGTYVSAGIFLPGEGKLLKLVPVMQSGGSLVCDESFSNVIINCNGSVTANVNKDITIGGNVTIYFKDSVVICMTGGNFKCGPYTESYAPQKSVNLNAQNGMQWAGLSFINVDTVIIQNTEFKDVKSIYDLNEGYSLDLINSKFINIDGCSITNTNTSATAAGVHINYVTNLYLNPDINITNNVIKISTDDGDGVYIHPYSWLTMTPYIYRNKIINTSSGGGEFGIFGFSLEGTAIKENYIENFENGIQTWYSSIDLFENTITTLNISNGFALNGIVSEYNLSTVYESRLGGSNVLTTLDGKCIHLDALDLNLADGNNIFNINDSAGYHLSGYYPMPLPSGIDPPPTNAMGNCFQIEGIQVSDESSIRHYVTWSDLVGMAFDFSNPLCPENPNYCDYYIGGNPNDTVWYECAGGMGGGQKDNYELQVTNYKLSAPQENVYKNIYDSLSINMRKRQYELASQKCMTLLNNYPDSSKTINAVDKLYHTALARDEVSELKSYYESFIQSHPNHTHIIQRMFYYIQKAKARLGQYESAMQGFQTIMNQFPTSYEGLAAKWDYMATQLLDSLSGQGGGKKETISDEQLTDEQKHEKLVSLVEDPLDKYDKKKFTKEDRKVIVINIVNSFEDKKTKETKRVKELEVKVFMNEATKSEKQEYKTKKVLKEVVRPQTVNTISEHIKAVQSDIEKVFDVGKNTKDVDNKTVAVIPLEYKLNQNYPNPFNPSTKINFELKHTGYVSLKIYDLLGREIAELVNETKDAGRYTIDFNASKYMMASGIYFYRIKAGEFVDTKRMVLVK